MLSKKKKKPYTHPGKKPRLAHCISSLVCTCDIHVYITHLSLILFRLYGTIIHYTIIVYDSGTNTHTTCNAFLRSNVTLCTVRLFTDIIVLP